VLAHSQIMSEALPMDLPELIDKLADLGRVSFSRALPFDEADPNKSVCTCTLRWRAAQEEDALYTSGQDVLQAARACYALALSQLSKSTTNTLTDINDYLEEEHA
jgi:hypothetical protein